MNVQFTMSMHVRSYEMDSFGHVNNAVYLNYLEYARGEYLRQRGLSFDDFQRWGAFPYVIKVEISYKASCRVHDELRIDGEITYWSRTGFLFHYEMHNLTSGRLAAEADIRFAFVNEQERPVAVPEEFKRKMGG